MASKGYKRKTSPALDGIVPKRGRPPGAKDEVTSMLLATGQATMAQLAQLFNTDAKTLPKRLRGVMPKGTRSGYKVYDVAEAAAFIVKPGYEIEEFLRQMSPQELPPLLLKEFWNGQRSRLAYERELGNLWPTEDVVASFGELLNVIRMTVLLVADDVEREAGLNEQQRLIIRRIHDAMIETFRKNIVEKFKDYHANRTPLTVDEGLDRYGADAGDEDDDENITAADDEEDLASSDDEDGNILAAEDDEEEDIDI